jgi:Flp pilus assembly protein TadD
LTAESQRLYALGRFHWNMRGDGRIESLRESVRDFQAVVARDPGNPLGYSGLADAYLSLYDYPCDERGCARIATQALSSARRAVELGPNSVEAHTSLAMMLHAFKANDDSATHEFQRAIAIDPHYATAHAWYGTMLTLHGRFDDARAQLAQAIALDPVAPASYAWLARASYYAHRYDNAVAYSREALALEPRRFETHIMLGLALAASGRSGDAIRAFRQLADFGGDPVQVRALIATAMARSGDNLRAKMLLTGAGSPQRGADYLPDVAMAWIAIGDQRRALAYFTATPPLDTMHRRLLAPDPRLDGIRNDRRFDTWTASRV